MGQPRVLGVIPARLGSERLERKPLQVLAGRPLIEWVWRRVVRIDVFDRVVVATDSEEVDQACRVVGADVARTAQHHRSGTERVAEVAALPAFGEYDVVVNVQGDEPFVTGEQVMGAVDRVVAGWDIGTVATPLASDAELHDPAVVKVVRRPDGGALYFSRAPVPYRRAGTPTARDLASGWYLRHIGVYAYTPEALRRWVILPENDLERIERLEQLRPLAAGLTIGVSVVAGTERGVDTPDDLARVERNIMEKKHMFLSTEA
jgi:3-deoxy-manno-octulosonate cytidylyltransferase (CMP-KDO synthetase)